MHLELFGRLTQKGRGTPTERRMAITQNASRVRVESSAKNGTLGAQGTLNANQIKFDTNISTNNGNLVAFPEFKRRHVILRKGTATQEINIVLSVDVDEVTCTMQEDWETVPASGDAYDVAYRLEDIETVAGMNYDSTTGQWYMDSAKRLIVGSTGLPGFFGMSHGQILRISDRSPDSGFRTGDDGIFCMGMLRNDIPNLGGTIIFMNNTDNELCWDILGGASVYINEFTLIAGNNPSGINSLDVTVDALANEVIWRDGHHYGIDSPFKPTLQTRDHYAFDDGKMCICGHRRLDHGLIIKDVAGTPTPTYQDTHCRRCEHESYVEAL